MRRKVFIVLTIILGLIALLATPTAAGYILFSLIWTEKSLSLIASGAFVWWMCASACVFPALFFYILFDLSADNSDEEA